MYYTPYLQKFQFIFIAFYEKTCYNLSMKLKVPTSLITLCRSVRTPIYVVGGYTRNHFAGLGETDIDLAGPIVATALGIEPSYRVRTVNYRLGTALIKCGRDEYEYTPFRTENYAPGGGHTPEAVYFTTEIRLDAARRDFTCNSIYYNPLTDEIYDPYNGVSDIEKGILRAHNPEKVFASDGLRILRLVRLACELGFKIEGETAKAAMAKAEYLKDISPERKRDELDKILIADTKYGVQNAHYRGLKLLERMGLWPYIIPEVAECAGVAQNPEYHKYDVMEHTFRTVLYAPPKIRLAALMHDIGKPYCVRTFGNMHGHERASEHIARFRLGAKGLRYSNETVEFVARLCAEHMYDMNGATSEAKVRLFVVKNFDIIDDLVDLNAADAKATGLEHETAGRFLDVKWKLIEEHAPLTLADLELDGNDLLERGIEGADIGKTLDELFRTCILEPRLNNREWLLSQADKIAARLKKASA